MKPAFSRSAPLARRLALCLGGLVLLAGCGKELGRLPFNAEATKTATMSLEAGEVAFWTDLAIRHEGAAVLNYHIELEQGGAIIASAECEPLAPHSIEFNSVEVRVGDSRSLKTMGKMSCSVQLAKSGLTTVRATLAFTTLPRRVALDRADLVLKQ
jgi:hypothetical protein